MFARLLALVCLLHVSLSGMNLGDVSVAIRLKTSADPSAFIVREMKTELERLMRSQKVQVTWWDSKQMTSSEKFVILELRGTCEAPSTAPKGPPIKDRTALASTPVEDGQILPFSWIHCDALRRFIGSSIADLPETMRNFLYGRAMARLAAHELYHVLSGTQAHEDSGIAKAQFSSADLLASDLSFQEIAPTEAAQDYVGAPVFEDALGK